MTLPKLVDSELSVENRIVVLRFNRDDVRNVLTGTQLIGEIERVVDWINATPDVSVLILSGNGHAFSAGGNLKEMSGRATSHADGPYSGTPQEVADKYQRGIQRIPLALSKLEVPSIAAVNGPAIGAGFDLALMCDIRIVASNVLLGETFLNLGLISGVGGAYWLTQRLGPQLAAELTLTGKTFGADEAVTKGIALEKVEADKLMERATELAKEIASKPPKTIRHSKRLLKDAQHSSLEEHLNLCATLQGDCHNQVDHLEAVNAFLEKRKPNFVGH